MKMKLLRIEMQLQRGKFNLLCTDCAIIFFCKSYILWALFEDNRIMCLLRKLINELNERKIK